MDWHRACTGFSGKEGLGSSCDSLFWQGQTHSRNRSDPVGGNEIMHSGSKSQRLLTPLTPSPAPALLTHSRGGGGAGRGGTVPAAATLGSPLKRSLSALENPDHTAQNHLLIQSVSLQMVDFPVAWNKAPCPS